MTRPKVPDDKRIRTAQACESCKRRKQKCNGLQPCSTCSKRNFHCEYAPHNGHTSMHGDGVDPGGTLASSPSDRRRSTITVGSPEEPAAKRYKIAGNGFAVQHLPPIQPPFQNVAHGLPTPVPAPTIPGRNGREIGSEPRSTQSTASGADEVTEVYTETRMLQDPTGRLLYLGDSATLSYLQYIRMIVESVAGPSQFTMDPNRHRLMETTLNLAPDAPGPVLLPDRKTTDILVASYFTNTNSLIEVFERGLFAEKLDACYNDPLTAEPTFVCLLYLVLAIGLLLATPIPGSQEHMLLKKLQDGHRDRAEMFFRSAKRLGDPTSGFEDADFWSVQALLLMSVYMLTRTKRNAAYAYHGMAVRSAYALGLHRLEAMVVFGVPDRIQRRNVWRSLYVLDRFLAAALGRPMSISEEDCSADALVTPDRYLAATDTDSSSYNGLTAAVRSCQVIGIILKKVYAQRRTSTRLAQDISDQCKGGPQKYNASLHWRQGKNKNIDPSHGMALLHVNLLYCHAVILLTRPFFLFLMNRLQEEKRGATLPAIRPGSKMEKWSEACVNAAYHTITLVQMSLDGGYLPQRDPFVIHFLFAAALVVLSSEFALLHRNAAYPETFQMAMSIMSYCAQSDPQADRLVYILTTFNHVIVRRESQGEAPAPFPDPDPVPNTPTGSMSTSSNDPMANFFLSNPPNPNPAVLTGAPVSRTFTPTGSRHHSSHGSILPPLTRRDSGNLSGPSSHSPGMMQSVALTPTTSAAGDLMNDAEWFHFDTLWENWAPPSGHSGAGGSLAAVTDPALCNDGGPSSSFDGGAGGVQPPGFADMSSSHGDGRLYRSSSGSGSGVGGGGMQVPLFPIMRLNE